MSPATNTLFYRDEDDDGGLSRQNVIIIAVCSSFGAIFLAYFLFLAIRKCRRSSNSAPHPLPQPLAHHRQLQVAQVEEETQRASTWYNPQFTAHHHVRASPIGGSRASLIDSDGHALTPSSHASIDIGREPSDSSHQRLPIPSASFLNRPSSRSSLSNSSDASWMTGREQTPLSPDSATPIIPRVPAQRPPMLPPFRHTRPLSMSSTHTYGSARTPRYGAPHAPHNQIQIILPTPLASANNSRESLPRGRYGSDVVDRRRSVADPWISLGAGRAHEASQSADSLPEMVAKPRRARSRHASSSSNYPVLYEGEAIPPVPPLDPAIPARRPNKLEKRRSMPQRGT